MGKRTFDPFRYSSGESVVASSDAQEVDYGVDFDPRRHVRQHGRIVTRDYSREVFNATQESRVSDFGVVNYPFDAPRKKREKIIPVAVRLKAGGVAATNGHTVGRPSGGMLAGTVARPTDEVSRVLMPRASVDDENESTIDRLYAGQLG